MFSVLLSFNVLLKITPDFSGATKEKRGEAFCPNTGTFRHKKSTAKVLLIIVNFKWFFIQVDFVNRQRRVTPPLPN